MFLLLTGVKKMNIKVIIGSFLIKLNNLQLDKDFFRQIFTKSFVLIFRQQYEPTLQKKNHCMRFKKKKISSIYK